MPNLETRQETNEHKALSHRFNRVVSRAKGAIFWERLWPKTVAPLSVGGLFLSASWAGLWGQLPPGGRMAGTLLFAAAFLASPFLVKSGTLRISEKDALKRLDSHIGDPDQRPAQTLRDKLADRHPPMAQDLWDRHLHSIWDKWGDQFKAGRPKPDMARHDPYRLRFAILMCAALTGALAGGDRLNRLEDALAWSTPEPPPPPLVLKAMVTPPHNINKLPLRLTAETQDEFHGGAKLSVHKNSKLTILISDRAPKISINGQNIEPEKEGKNKTSYRYETTLTEENNTIIIEGGPQWRFDVAPDNAPEAEINTTESDKAKPGSLGVTFTQKDDYGVKESQIIIKIPEGSDPEATPLPSAKFPPLHIP